MKNRCYKVALLVAICLPVLLMGCGYIQEKLCRIQIRDGNGTELAVLEDLTQEDTEAFMDTDNWTECESFDETLKPQYIITLYQEKTPTVIPLGEDTYEQILEYTTYENSDVIKTAVGEDTIKSGMLPEQYLTFYYAGSEKFFLSLYDAVK